MKYFAQIKTLLLYGLLIFSIFLSACNPSKSTPTPDLSGSSTQAPARSPIALAPSGPAQFVFSATLNNKTEITLANTDGVILKQLTQSEGGASCPAVSPDGMQIAYCSVQDIKSQLMLMGSDGSDPHLIAEEIEGCGCSPDAPLAWSPDGKWIALPVSGLEQSAPVYNIFVVRVEDGKVTQLTSDPQRYGGLIWNPDSKSILLTGTIGGQGDIYRINISDKKASPLTGTPITGAAYSWSPDGKKLLYFADSGGGNFDIFLLQTGSSQPIRLTDAPGFDSYPTWFQDGQHILFVSTRDGDQEIYRMNADGSGQTNLTNNPGVLDIWPSLSPDGQYVIYLTSNNNQWDSWIMKADGSDKRKLTDIIGIPSRITWKP